MKYTSQISIAWQYLYLVVLVYVDILRLIMLNVQNLLLLLKISFLPRFYDLFPAVLFFAVRSMTKEKLMLILGRDKQILPQEEWFVVYNFRIVTLLLLCGFCWVLLRCCWRGTRRHEFEIQVCTYTYLLLP